MQDIRTRFLLSVFGAPRKNLVVFGSVFASSKMLPYLIPSSKVYVEPGAFFFCVIHKGLVLIGLTL